ncbi:hypothetical protein HDE_11126 [Halotydeus destructor]|nr:hypothetical protein HDE_11126 [Halotydeus destructor]
MLVAPEWSADAETSVAGRQVGGKYELSQRNMTSPDLPAPGENLFQNDSKDPTCPLKVEDVVRSTGVLGLNIQSHVTTLFKSKENPDIDYSSSPPRYPRTCIVLPEDRDVLKGDELSGMLT